MSVLTLEAKLERTDSSTPWGFRMQGGKDFSSPLTIQNVNPGSLAAKCGLQTGDIILKIGTSDTKLLKHKEAQTSILDCGNRLDLLLQRGGTAGSDRFNGPEINTSNSWNSQPQTISPAGQTSQQSFNSAPRPFGSQAPARSNYEPILSQQTSNLSLSSGGTAPPPAPAYKPASTPAFQPARTPVATATSAKPWAPPPAPVSNTTARPFGSTAPPVPTGVGATRGKKGDAAMNPAMLPAAGRIPVCSGCNMPVRGPFVTALGKCWCPDHFICANPQCGTKLLDIGFVEEGGQLYCERDYAIHFAPHCDRCGQAVIGECVNAMQKSFHPHCFLCAQCHKPIGGTKFHIEDGKYYCEADWAAMFQTICAGCDFPIEPGDRWVEALGRNFHSECFNCAKCQVNLEGQQFCAKGGKAYCKNHAR
uniref:PDZ and LIM domain protein Zasp n=1 Tax=Arion vulgaris TaxID=1028688 RepID=A0A0B7ADC4_9EUPU